MQEGWLFSGLQFNFTPSAANTSSWTTFLVENVPSNYIPPVLERYPLTDWRSDGSPAWTVLFAAMTDAIFRCPARRALRATAANGVPVWAYRFAQTPACPWLGSLASGSSDGAFHGPPTHSSDIPYVLVHTGALPPPDGQCSMTGADLEVSERMNEAWTAMARYGRPTSSNDSWPKWDDKASMGWVINGSDWVRPVSFDGCELWDEIAKAERKLAASVYEIVT